MKYGKAEIFRFQEISNENLECGMSFVFGLVKIFENYFYSQ